MAGSFSDHSILSFCQNKIITTGEGGAILTDSKEVCQKLKLLRSHGRCGDNAYFTSNYNPDYITLGFNWRMSNIAASLGIAQITKIEKIIKLRRKAADYYDKNLKKIKGISLIQSEKNVKNVYQMYTIVVDNGLAKREALKRFLEDKGIACKVYFSPVHLSSFYKKELNSKQGDLPITEEMAEKVLSLPIYPGITKSELKYIINQIKAFFK
jgi:perosamine synthetase